MKDNKEARYIRQIERRGTKLNLPTMQDILNRIETPKKGGLKMFGNKETDK